MIWNTIKHHLGLASRRNTEYPEFYRTYLNNFTKHDAQIPIYDQSFCVFDTETTGLDMAKDKILSIGAVRVCQQSMDIADSLSIIISHDGEQDASAVVIHGLVKTAEQGITPEKAVSLFYQFVGSDIIVGHHVAFDLNMVHKLSHACSGGPLKNVTLDTAFLAKRLDHPTDPHSLDRKEYTLDKLCERFSVLPKARHTADGDALITALLFLKLLDRLHRKGIRKVRQLVQ
jgi:DNA polymerase III subunit epsilon